MGVRSRLLHVIDRLFSFVPGSPAKRPDYFDIWDTDEPGLSEKERRARQKLRDRRTRPPRGGQGGG